MTELLAKYFSVFSLSMFKFVFGPVTGASLGLNVIETWLLTSAGMMATVLVITYAGSSLRARIVARFGKKQTISARKRRMVRMWNRYGIAGVAFLTPLLLSPPGGAIVAVSFGEKKHKIILYMLLSAIFWGLFLSIVISLAGEKFIELVT